MGRADLTRVLTALACTLATVVTVAAQQATFSARREDVRVDVLVTDHGRPVPGLQAGDFEVLDSGVAQQVDLASFERLPITVLLALDASSSITAAQLADLRSAGKAVLSGLRVDDQAALLTFSDAVSLRARPTANVATIGSTLDALAPAPQVSSGGTALVDAIYTATMLGDRDNGRSLLIAFSDGIDTSSWLRADRVLQVARRSNVVAYAVSTAKLAGGSFLDELTEVTGGAAIEVKSTADLREAFVRVLDEFRQRYLVSYSPANVPQHGWHPLTVHVKSRKVDVRARAGYAN